MKIFGLNISRSTPTVNTQGYSYLDKTIFADLWNDSLAGVTINQDIALNISSVWACNKVLSEDIAALPLHVYERTDKGAVKATNHPIYNLLHDSPNEFMTPVVFHELMQTYVNLWGNAYAIINRDSNYKPVSFEVLHPKDVMPVKKTKLWYSVAGYKNLVRADDMIHILAIAIKNDYKGISPIIAAKEVLGGGLALQEFANRFFGSGANLSGTLSTDQKLTPEAFKRLADGFDARYAGIDKAHKTAVLEQGLKFQRIGIEPEAAQFLESRRFSVEEIARWFRIPPHMIADLSKSSFSNIEQQSMNYVIYTLRSWLVRWEQEYNRKLFTTEERKKYFVQFNIDGLLRGDAAARAALYQALYNMGAINANEIREKENMNPYEGGDTYRVQLNLTDASKVPEAIKQPDNGKGNTIL
jgi:HK97 family phage portal protein